MYGEMVDPYSEDPKLKEFIDVGMKFIQSLASVGIALPFYKLHIYTKTYRDYVDTLNKLQDRGMQLLIHAGHGSRIWLMIFMNHVSLLSTEIVHIVSSSVVYTNVISDSLAGFLI